MLNNIDKVFLALSDKHRIKLFELVIDASRICYAEGEDFTYRGNCISELQKHLNLSQSTISHHISLLEDANLIKSVRRGKWIHLFPVLGTIQKLHEFIGEMAKYAQHDNKLHSVEVGELSEEGFSELVSLISNHGMKIIHHNPFKSFFVLFKDSIYSIILSGKEISFSLVSGFDDTRYIEELKSLTKKYLPSVK